MGWGEAGRRAATGPRCQGYDGAIQTVSHRTTS
jgi:hypothetical protein